MHTYMALGHSVAWQSGWCTAATRPPAASAAAGRVCTAGHSVHCCREVAQLPGHVPLPGLLRLREQRVQGCVYARHSCQVIIVLTQVKRCCVACRAAFAVPAACSMCWCGCEAGRCLSATTVNCCELLLLFCSGGFFCLVQGDAPPPGVVGSHQPDGRGTDHLEWVQFAIECVTSVRW